MAPVEHNEVDMAADEKVFKPKGTPTPAEFAARPEAGSADTLAALYKLNTDLADRSTVGDSAVGIVDTLQSIGSLIKAPLPGETNTLQQSAANSQWLDQFRSAAYMAERATREMVTDPNLGFAPGVIQGLQTTLGGDNVIADAVAQVPYLLIGSVAKGMGVAATAKIPGLLGKTVQGVAGTGQGAVINRIAALSGALEGGGGYAQTYQRAIEQGLSEEEATKQAQVAGLVNVGIGTALGRATPGFELSPTGKFAGNMLSHVTDVTGEILEETGIAVGQTVTDNILAGKKPMEGVGQAVGEAAAISGAFTGAIRAPRATLDTTKAILGLSKEVGGGVVEALGKRARTPEGAAVNAAAVAAFDQGLAQNLGGDPASTGSSSEPGVPLTPNDTAPSTGQNVTQPTLTEEKPPVRQQYQLPLGEPEARPKSATPTAAETILTTAALETRADITTTPDGKVDEAQAAAIERAETLVDVGKVAEAEAEIAQMTDEQVKATVEQANQGNEEAQQTVQAIGATNIARLPAAVVPEVIRPLVQALQQIPAATAPTTKTEETRQQILNKGWETPTGKAVTRKRGMAQYMSGIANALRAMGTSDTTNPIGAATKAAGFLQHLRARGEAFKRAGELVAEINKRENLNNPAYAEYVKQGYVEVEGTATLNEDGKRKGDAFKIHLNSKKSQAMVGEVLADVAAAEQMWGALESTAPQLAAASMERAKAEKAKLDAVLAARAEIAEAVNPELQARAQEEQKRKDAAKAKAEAARAEQDKLEQTIADTVGKADSREKLKAVGERILARRKDLRFEQVKRLREAYRAKRDALRATPPPVAPAPAAPTPALQSSAAERIRTNLDIIRSMIKDANWGQVGGRLVIDGEGRKSRTTWITSLEWWSRGLGLSMTKTREVLQKIVTNPDAKLGKAQARVVNAMLDFIEEQQREQNRIETERKAAEEAARKQEEADRAADRAEDEARRAYEADAEARLAQEAAVAKPAGVPASESNPDADQKPGEQPARQNPLLAVTNWVRNTFREAFDLDSTNTVAGWLDQLKAMTITRGEETSTAFDLYRNEAANLFKLMNDETGILRKGISDMVGQGKEDYVDKPYGVGTALWVKDENGKISIPEEVRIAFAWAGAIVMYRNAAKFPGLMNDDTGLPVRDALPAVWAQDVAKLAMKMLGAKPKRNASVQATQGIPLIYALSTIEALIQSENFQTEQEGVYTVAALPVAMYQQEKAEEGDLYPSQVLIPTQTARTAALDNINTINAVEQLFDGEPIWEAQSEPYTTADTTIQYTNTALTEQMKTALLNRQKVEHGLHADLYSVFTLLGDGAMKSLFTGWYDSVPEKTDGTVPSSVREWIKSQHERLELEFMAAREYFKITDSGAKGLFYKYRLGINNRAKTVLGPQNNKFLRDLFSSAKEELDLDTPAHREYLQLALAQAFGIKTDINDRQTVLNLWADKSKTVAPKARAVWAAFQSGDQTALLAALKQDKPYTPREINALLTYGRVLAQNGKGTFTNFLPFEIDGKTNGAFNTELFFGLGVHNGANLEQGGLFLSKTGATFESERERMKDAYQSADFYERINKGGVRKYVELMKEFVNSQGKEKWNTWIRRSFIQELQLLEAANMLEIERDADGNLVEDPNAGELKGFPKVNFKRDAGKLAAIPVQYGGAPKGVKSQMWAEIARNINLNWVAAKNQFDRETDPAKRRELSQRMAHYEAMLQGSESFRMSPKQLKDSKDSNAKRWHYGIGRLAEALHGAYRGEKSVVAQVTDNLVALTNFAFAIKRAQWDEKLAELKASNEANKALKAKYSSTGVYELSQEEYDRLNASTLDMSFSTLNGGNTVSLNSTEFDRGAVSVSGMGTSLDANLNIPVPRPVGVRILALLTIAGGDASMGGRFFQENWNATDVFDGIELKVTDIDAAGTALNSAVWDTAGFDILRSFHTLNENMTQYLNQATDEQKAAILKAWNQTAPKSARFNDFFEMSLKLNEAFDVFNHLYKDQRAGWALLQQNEHTMSQMGGGGTFKTPKTEPRSSAALEGDFELSLEEDAVRAEAADFDTLGTKEEGLYPNQPKNTEATRIENEQGLIDVIMKGVRWRGTNTWNSAKAKILDNKSAGLRRLMHVLKLAAEAGVAYDSDQSVHGSAIKMYLRGKKDGFITFESRFTDEELQAAVDGNKVLRTTDSVSLDGEPVFRNVRLIGKESIGSVKVDSSLQTAFEVSDGKLNRENVIEVLDRIQWRNPIHRAVWKRIRNLLPANLTVMLASNDIVWESVLERRGVTRSVSQATAGMAVGDFVLLRKAAPAVMLHELIHTIFTKHIDNFFSNINAVPVEMRAPINDLVQLMERFKKLPAVGRVGFVQKVMNSYAFRGQPQDELGEMLAYVFTEDDVINELSPGFVQRVINRVKQVLGFIVKIPAHYEFYNEAMDVFRTLTNSVPTDAVLVDSVRARFSRNVANGLESLEQLTEDAFADLAQRIARGQKIELRGVEVENQALLATVQTVFNLNMDQQRMFTRVYHLLRAGQRPADLEQFVSATFTKHAQKNLFNKSKDAVAAVMALASVEPTFAAQLDALWNSREDDGVVNTLIDKALNTAQQNTSADMINEAISAMLLEREHHHSFIGTAASRLDRLGNAVMEKLGQTAAEKAQDAPEVVATLLQGIAALTTEKGAKAFGEGLVSAVNSHTDQRWLQDLVAAVVGTKGTGKLIYRAHNQMMSAINRTRSIFDNTLPRELAKLFPKDFDGWNTLFESFGRLDVQTLGSSAAEMYLNDAERQRMITVLESKVDNWIDAKNLGYYLVHRQPRPGIAQDLLRNARAIADNLNGERRKAPDSLVEDVDQLVTLYAIDALSASERAKVGNYFTQHRESMDKLIGMLKHVKDAERQHERPEYRYAYWKDSLPMSTDVRSSTVIGNSIKGAQLMELGYIRGKKYKQTSGDPESDLYYYHRKFSPPPVFSQGILATVQQTGMGINYTTAASVTPEVGTMLTNPQVVDYIKRTKGRDSNLIAIHNFQGELVGYERMLDPAIVRESLKGNNTLLHVSIGKKLGRITEENMARRINQEAIKLMADQWKEGKEAGRENEYETVNSSTDKQVARAWENIPADIKADLEAAFDGPVMIRKDLLANTIGYHNTGALEIFTGDASLSPQTRKALLGIIQTVFFGPKGTQIFLAAEQALKEGVATAKDIIIVRSLVVAWQNAQASLHLVIANGVPPAKVIKWYRQGMAEIKAFNRLQREIIQLRIDIAGTTDPTEKDRLRALQKTKDMSIKRLSIYPLIEAGELSDLPEGLEDVPSHSYLGDLSGWMDKHLREKIHPRAPTILANAIFAKDSALHDALSKSIQAGDFLGRYAIYQHMVEQGASTDKARDEVRDEMVSYQTNPGRMRASLETYGMIYWSQFTLRAQSVLLNRFRKNPFSFFVSQGIGDVMGTPGPLDGAIYERGLDNSTGLDQVFSAPSAHIYAKVF